MVWFVPRRCYFFFLDFVHIEMKNSFYEACIPKHPHLSSVRKYVRTSGLYIPLLLSIPFSRFSNLFLSLANQSWRSAVIFPRDGAVSERIVPSKCEACYTFLFDSRAQSALAITAPSHNGQWKIFDENGFCEKISFSIIRAYCFHCCFMLLWIPMTNCGCNNARNSERNQNSINLSSVDSK